MKVQEKPVEVHEEALHLFCYYSVQSQSKSIY